MEAPDETLLVDRLAEITDNSIAQGAGSLAVVGAASNKDCGNGVPHIDKVFVELNAGHRWHMDVGDQACGFGKTRGSEEIGCRCEILDGIAQRRHEPPQGRAIESIIVDDRDEWRLRHTASGSSPEQISPRPLSSFHKLVEEYPPINILARKL
jgi:hypothetical protein